MFAMTAAVLITVAAVEGSAPREAGAKMLVTHTQQFGTIGGGHLEMRACEIARAMLAGSDVRRVERFALGPSLGQCCGGVVHLLFERIDLDELDDKNLRQLIDPNIAHHPPLVLFGAGHVGSAIVRALADLPCSITWVDEREDVFPDTIPSNVTVEITDIPEAMVSKAPAHASYLVMTHSHALDQQLAEAILHRADVKWFGLIGSKTKRAHFVHRLQSRGIPQERLDAMVCPIGVPGIRGKAPAIIAASVCAQLLMVWEK